MTAFNVVRFRVKPGNEQRFIDTHRTARRSFKGFAGGSLIQTGDGTFCLIGEWRSAKSIANARPEMIAFLDTFRDLLEDLGGGQGVTDPVSGEVVARLRAAKPAKKRAAKKTAAKKGAAKKGAKKKAAKRTR